MARSRKSHRRNSFQPGSRSVAGPELPPQPLAEGTASHQLALMLAPVISAVRPPSSLRTGSTRLELRFPRYVSRSPENPDEAVGRTRRPFGNEQLRQDFSALAEQWRRDTVHLSQIFQKVAHPAYFRIMGLGERVVPLLLEALRDRPAHWFVALKATTNVDPVPSGANPSQAREAWLEWGRKQGFLISHGQ